jgi:hypothetical protein
VYLKSKRPPFGLHRNEDAERDCNAVLALNAFNAKALFRRGQAKAGVGRLDEARQGGCAMIVRGLDTNFVS